MKILNEHLNKTLNNLVNVSDNFNLVKHSKIIGSCRETLINQFLKKNLPNFVDYHNGELFDCENNRSGEIDLILHPITSPKINLIEDINIFPVETVLAGIEIKSNLTTGKTGSFYKALDTCKKAKQLIKLNGSIDFEDATLSTIPFIIFAFNAPTKKTLLSSLNKYVMDNKEPLIYKLMPDMIVVLKSTEDPYVICKTKSWLYSGKTFNDIFKFYNPNKEPLLAPFKLLNSLVEHWSCNIINNKMPINEYSTEIKKQSLFDIINKK